MATFKASKTHVTLKLTEREASKLCSILAQSRLDGALNLYAATQSGLKNLRLKQRFALPSATDPRD